ncbi:hypothetical protein [Paenibacillus selenitireducens]|uniref:hypothetical protein n=1 Tax=Paenibacillus selenitireducens TaxID=1324314 RepID=UPI0018E940BA|nr:hypothetical protein [Paenibacillus selenitireducens]
MFRIGDRVVFVVDGTIGIVMGTDEDRCHIVWEDFFASWEKNEMLRKEEIPSVL